jgi:hypothetical protein
MALVLLHNADSVLTDALLMPITRIVMHTQFPMTDYVALFAVLFIVVTYNAVHVTIG